MQPVKVKGQITLPAKCVRRALTRAELKLGKTLLQEKQSINQSNQLFFFLHFFSVFNTQGPSSEADEHDRELSRRKVLRWLDSMSGYSSDKDLDNYENE